MYKTLAGIGFGAVTGFVLYLIGGTLDWRWLVGVLVIELASIFMVLSNREEVREQMRLFKD